MSDNNRIISTATEKNWARLHVENAGMRLASRANKRLSKKNIIPLELISSADTLDWLHSLLDMLQKNQWEISSVMYSLCIALLQRRNIAPAEEIFIDLPKYEPIGQLLHLPLPENERDLLGLAYQSLLSEGDRNRMGAYYTPPCLIDGMMQGLDDFIGTCIDPCCGSGMFLIALLERGISPEQLFGCDIDPIAVMLARVNLLLHCRGGMIPKVVCADFLRDTFPFPQKFDLIITNPPWGALSDKMNWDGFSSCESFSCFLYAARNRLSQTGSMRFLLPEAFLSVRTHRAIRRYLLTASHIACIRLFDETFSGVVTRCIGIEVQSARQSDLICWQGKTISSSVSSSFYLQDADCALHPLTELDTRILQKIFAFSAHTLKNSTWALGIVTGDNKHKLFDTPADGLEPIYTGKEVEPYVLKSVQKYIRYDRAVLQQTAKEAYYRAEKKLIYRFISDRPIFALDTQGRLCLNSANILIPKVDGLSLYAVLALLNSAPIQYVYMKLCGGVKVLKSHLEKLPLPALTEAQDAHIRAQVRSILSSSPSDRRIKSDALDTYFYALFDLTEEEQTHIAKSLRK